MKMLSSASSIPRKRPRVDDQELETLILAGRERGFGWDWLDIMISNILNDRGKALVFLAHVQNVTAINPNELERFRSELLSYNVTIMAHLQQLNLTIPESYTTTTPRALSGITYALPLKIQHACLQAAGQVLVTLRGLDPDTKEESRARIFDAYWTPIVGLFNGGLYDNPEYLVSSGRSTFRGILQHELYFFRGALLLVAGIKMAVRPSVHAVQLYAEMFCAAKFNDTKFNDKLKHDRGFRVYGLLTDITWFYFFEYHPATRTFYCFERIVIAPEGNEFLQGMARMANKLFTVIFHAYLGALRASQEHSLYGWNARDTSHGTQNPAEMTPGEHHPSPSWSEAVRFAEDARCAFEMPALTATQLDANSATALQLLKESTDRLPGSHPTRQLHIDADKILTGVYDRLINEADEGDL